MSLLFLLAELFKYKDTMTGRWWEETNADNPRDAEASLGSWNKCTPAPRSKGQASGAKTSAQSVPGKLRQVHTRPATQRVSPGCWEKPTQVATMQKDPHKHLPSKFLPAADGGTGEQKYWQWSHRQVEDWRPCRYAERATLKQRWKWTLLTPWKQEWLPKGILNPSVQFSSVAQSCPALCNPMNRSTPGLPVHHQLPEFTQTHVHWVSDAIQPSHPLSPPSPPVPNPSENQSPIQRVKTWGGQSTGFSALASSLPKKSQGWSSEWTGWIS